MTGHPSAAAEATSTAELVERATALVRHRRRAILGITGSPGAGKSTLAEWLIATLQGQPPPGLAGAWVAHVPMDGFHLADAELDRLGRRDRKGAPDTFDAAGYLALLRRLLVEVDSTVYAPGFERTLEQPLAGAIPVPPEARLVVTEGNYLLLAEPPWSELRSALTETWFCAADPARRLAQLTARHAAFGKATDAALAWAHGPDEANARLVEASRSRADLVIPDGVLAQAVGRT